MAILVDSLGNLDHTVRRKFKRIFAQLDDTYIVRSLSTAHVKVAQLLIERPDTQWLLLGWHPHNLHAGELDLYKSLSTILAQVHRSHVYYLAVADSLESLSYERSTTLSHLLAVEKNEFFSNGTRLIEKYTNRLPAAAHQWLKKQVLPEININAECSSRREIHQRNNTAQLQHFFLDYDQERAAKLDIIGEPLADQSREKYNHSLHLINGVAGCGKTLILINRAIMYCKLHPKRKILLLVHNKPVTNDIKYKFQHYLNGVPNNLTIKTFHAFALAQKKRVTGSVNPLFSEKSLQPFKARIFSQDNPIRHVLQLSDEHLWSEFEYINEYLIKDKAAYIAMKRQGRGFALQRNQRILLWQLYQQAMAIVCKPHCYLPSLYIREMSLHNTANQHLDMFDHVLLDEAQFFAPSWLLLVLKSIYPHGQLFMCADPNQGFLKTGLSWKRIGLNVRGRTQKLTYSYRSTYEILIAANALLEELHDDPEDFVKPQLTNMLRGDKPRVVYSDTQQDERQRFLNELRQAVNDNTWPLDQMMVLCGESVSTYKIKPAIDRVLGAGKTVNCNDNLDLKYNYGERIKLMSINSCTGMEAGITFVLGVGEILNAEHNLDFSKEAKKTQRQESLRKLYVAMTRAGQKLVLFSTKRLPENVARYIEES